jgi:hypothetical protein
MNLPKSLNKKYVIDNIYASTDSIKSHVFKDLDVDLKDVFEIYLKRRTPQYKTHF